MLKLEYPIRQSIAFSNRLFQLYRLAITSRDDQILFDLSRTKSLTPFGIIMLTATIAECLKEKKQCTYRKPVDLKLERFLNNIGFNKYFGLKSTEPLPDRIEAGNVQMSKMTGLSPLFIERITEIFDYHLNMSPGVKGSLSMSLIETMTNVIDHNEVQDYYI